RSPTRRVRRWASPEAPGLRGHRAVGWKGPRDGRRDQPGGARRFADEAAGPSGAEEPLLDRPAHAGLCREQGAGGGILALREVLPAGGDEQRPPIGAAEGAGGDLPGPDRDLDRKSTRLNS